MSSKYMEFMTFPKMNKKGNYAETLIEEKHLEYIRKGKTFRLFYYITRLLVGFSAGILPFVIRSHPTYAVLLSVTIIFATVVDLVFNPKAKWALYSRTTDYLTVIRIKLSGDYETYKEAIDLILESESKHLDMLIPLKEVLSESQINNSK